MAFSLSLIFGLAVYHSHALFLERRHQGVSNDDTPMAAARVHNHSDTLAAQPATLLSNASSFSARNSSAQLGNQSWGYGVVHFLFLVNDDLPHAHIWQSFFAKAPHGSWKVAVHCKDPVGCARNGVFANNPGFEPVPTTGTWYCHDLVTAMKQLLLGALAYGAAQSTGGREKFVFVSESTLPIKPFNEIHSTLLLDDASDFCLFPSDQWASASIDGQFVKLLKQHQWVVLSRQHAELFINRWVPVDSNSKWRIWLTTGAWLGQERYVDPTAFYYPRGANTCTDEYAFMATIFGALEPLGGKRFFPSFGGGEVDMQSHTTQGRCRTWSYWDYSWDPASAALAKHIADDVYESEISCYPKCFARPASLEKVGEASLHALRQSPFLFARKFSATVWMPKYYDIVLS